MFSLFILLVGIRIMNKYLDGDAEKLALIQNPNSGNGTIENYFPVIFHSTIIILILISCFTSEILNQERIHVLIADGVFQFVSTLLILIIGIINPFTPLSNESKQKLLNKSADRGFEWFKWMLEDKKWQLVKALICVLIVAYFIYSGYLVIPNLNQGLLSGIAVILILFFVFGNIVQILRDPALFKSKTLFRLSMLYRSFKLSFFISIGLIALVFVMSFLLKIDSEKLVNIEGIILLVYNTVMAINEFKILKSNT
ncbi:hypothetical protein [Pedobacter aquatilis]|uniref:hypothetical protein n=1 Tax=Pedobacter aquatilis TaxID=351343 RepID=UPI002930007B|nr:hypothetical protein [Pedobacter aquatilis]